MGLTIHFHTDGMLDKQRGNKTTQGDFDSWSNLKRHSYANETLASFTSGESPAFCYMEDPPGHVDIGSSTFILAATRVGARFWYKPTKGSRLVSKCNLTDIRHGVYSATKNRVRVTCVSPISFTLLASTDMHLNFLGIRVRSGDPTVLNSLLSKLKTTSEELKDAISGCCPAIVLVNGTLCSAHPPAGYLGVAEDAYAVIIAEVLRRNSTSHVYTGGRAQVYMRGDGLLTKGELLPETRVATTET